MAIPATTVDAVGLTLWGESYHSGALDDFMLKVLIFSAIIAITFDMILAKPEDRSHGKFFFLNF